MGLLRDPGEGSRKDVVAMGTSRKSGPPDSDERAVVAATQARQGVTGHNVRYVLLAGTAAVVVLFVIVYAAFFS